MKRIRGSLACVAVLAAFGAGCSLDDSGYQPGELGNGGFFFNCEDAVQCNKTSQDASKFPKAVSLGSTFAVRFQPKQSSTIDIHFDDSQPDRGITVQPIADFITRGPKGLTAVKSGYATLASRDAAGQLVDYTVIRVAKPDGLVVYPVVTSDSPAPVTAVTLSASETKDLHAIAQQNKQDLGGSLQLEWTSSDPNVFTIASVSNGTAKIAAVGPGNATLTASGGTFNQKVSVVVKP